MSGKGNFFSIVTTFNGLKFILFFYLKLFFRPTTKYICFMSQY